MNLEFLRKAQNEDSVTNRLIHFKENGRPSQEELQSESPSVRTAMHEWNKLTIKHDDLTETRNHRRKQDEKPFLSDPVVQSEKGISNDELENDLCVDPNQLTEVIQHINDQNGPVPAAGQTEIGMPSPIPDGESDNVTDELPSHAEPGNATMNASTSESLSGAKENACTFLL
eukprot:gene8367-14341_t